MVSRLSRTAPLLSALLSCAAALRLRSTSVASSLRRHVKPPSSLKSKRGQTHPLIHCPSTPPLNPLSSGLSVKAWTGRGPNQKRRPLRSRAVIGRKSRAKVPTPTFAALCAVLPEIWSGKSKLEYCGFMCASCLEYRNQHDEPVKLTFIGCRVGK